MAKIYEKQPPKKQITDEQRHRRIRYYHSDREPYDLHAEVELMFSGGVSEMVDVLVDDKNPEKKVGIAELTAAEKSAVLSASEKIWKAAIAKSGGVEKP